MLSGFIKRMAQLNCACSMLLWLNNPVTRASLVIHNAFIDPCGTPTTP